MTVDGPRFHAFMPLGSKALLEHEILVLAKAFGWDPPTVKKMACSERHRFVKMQAEIARQESLQAKGQTSPVPSNLPTGINNTTNPAKPGTKKPAESSRTVNLDYSGI